MKSICLLIIILMICNKLKNNYFCFEFFFKNILFVFGKIIILQRKTKITSDS